jgi:hypothetical protein
MMYASHYMSEWTPVLSLCEMPIRRCVRAKSRAGSEIIVERSCGVPARHNHCWRSKDRRSKGQVKRQVNGARLKAAATNSTATSTPGHYCVSDFDISFSAVNSTEVKNEKLQH